MTVAELILELEKLPQDMDVLIHAYDDIYVPFDAPTVEYVLPNDADMVEWFIPSRIDTHDISEYKEFVLL